ncbi:MAG: MFS transporter [Simkaniaceae bacterium]
MGLINFFKPSPHIKEIENAEEVRSRYRYWRLRIFAGMYVGYAFYYFTRKSLVFAMPTLMSALGYSKSQLGILASILSISYGLSKFLSGIVADRSNPRAFMAFGLILTGFFNIFFGFSSSLVLFALFWGLNGWFQGWGWPPCARLLTHWYSQSERGRWWGLWNTSHNVGGLLIPIVASYYAAQYGWRFALFVPGILSIMAGLFLIYALRDTPQSLGLPPIEKFMGEESEREVKSHEKELSTKQILLQYVLKNRFIWILAISYFFIYVVRQGINDWGQLFLFEHKHYSLIKAGSCIGIFELGGFFGSLAAGFLSDKIYKGRRGPVNVIFSFGVILALLGLWLSPAGRFAFDASLMFSIGFFIFGPQMLIGMAAAELAHKKAAGTASGFAGWIGYLGAASAGYPVGKVSQDYGWSGVFVLLVACSITATLLLIPLWSVRKRVDQLESSAV